MKKILFCNKNGIPPYHISGAELSIDEILKEMVSYGYEVSSLNTIERFLLYKNNYTKLMDNNITVENDVYTKHILNNTNNYNSILANLIESYKPDIIFTQMFDVELLKKITNQNIPIVLFVHGVVEDTEKLESIGADLYVCLSNFIATKLLHLGDKVCVIYPIIKKSDFFNSYTKDKQNILFVNPTKNKGVEVALHLAQKYKYENFIFFENWRVTNKKYLYSINELDNIKLMPITSNYKSIYDGIKLLIYPSQNEEGFGRCIVEANFNGIPTIASNIGGIPEALGKSQILVEDYNNLSAWESAFDKVFYNIDYYKQLTKEAYNNANNFEKISSSKMLSFLEKLSKL
ncbi:MAG: glycosyltransferase [Defluviitaleaceae bacterium]|nr:glycosyltransferase [Defluviitaleaceae bacterium]